jgi:peptidoglycan/LPS O-acetylase OafA/YrhL
MTHFQLPLYSSSSASHLPYRPDIDGLRAIAVFSVVAFHAFPSLLPGGFIGVDIFFVISGFLISTLILQALANGDFTFRHFLHSAR